MKAIYVRKSRLLFIPSDRRNPDTKGLFYPFLIALRFNILNVFVLCMGKYGSGMKVSEQGL